MQKDSNETRVEFLIVFHVYDSNKEYIGCLWFFSVCFFVYFIHPQMFHYEMKQNTL